MGSLSSVPACSETVVYYCGCFLCTSVAKLADLSWYLATFQTRPRDLTGEKLLATNLETFSGGLETKCVDKTLGGVFCFWFFSSQSEEKPICARAWKHISLLLASFRRATGYFRYLGVGNTSVHRVAQLWLLGGFFLGLLFPVFSMCATYVVAPCLAVHSLGPEPSPQRSFLFWLLSDQSFSPPAGVILCFLLLARIKGFFLFFGALWSASGSNSHRTRHFQLKYPFLEEEMVVGIIST